MVFNTPKGDSVEFNFVHITHRETYIAVQLGYNTTREKILLLESLVSDKTESFLGVRIAMYLQVCQGISNRCQGHKKSRFLASSLIQIVIFGSMNLWNISF